MTDHTDPSVLALSPQFSTALAAWQGITCYSVNLATFRLYCFVNSRTQLDITVEPTGNIRVAAQSAWEGIRDGLNGLHPKLVTAEALDDPSSRVVMTASVGFGRQIGHPESISTLLIGGATVFWVILGAATFAMGHAFEMVTGAISGWIAAGVVLAIAGINRLRQKIQWR